MVGLLNENLTTRLARARNLIQGSDRVKNLLLSSITYRATLFIAWFLFLMPKSLLIHQQNAYKNAISSCHCLFLGDSALGSLAGGHKL
jgi:hypothetical protein